MIEHKCCVCGASIPPMRVEYLSESGLHKDHWTCVAHSQVKRKVGFFKQGRVADPNEVDTSELVICDYIEGDNRADDDSEDESNE